MHRRLAHIILFVIVATVGGPLRAQAPVPLPRETASTTIDLHRYAAPMVPPRTPHALATIAEQWAYEGDCLRRLLPLQTQINRCIDAQRLVDGEFHARIDIQITKDGRVDTVTNGPHPLRACLLPHLLPLRFSPLEGKVERYTFILQLASPACRLGRRTPARIVEIYPLGDPTAVEAYRLAVFWSASPWTSGTNTCDEVVDRTIGQGYEVTYATEITPAGVPEKSTITVVGPLAQAALKQLIPCAAPFLKHMRLPRHAGPVSYTMRHGSRTAQWEPED